MILLLVYEIGLYYTLRENIADGFRITRSTKKFDALFHLGNEWCGTKKLHFNFDSCTIRLIR